MKMFDNANEEIKTVAEKFCTIYFDCWKKAMESEEGQYKYRGKKYDDVGLLKAWTDFHMKNILYKLAEELCYLHKKEGDKKYKTHSCQECKNCTKEKGGCGYGESWQQEYYKVDLLLSNYQGRGNWCNDFYIEHENDHFRLDKKNKIDKQGWYYEFDKLLPLNTSKDGMRVIISYDDFNFDYDRIEDKERYLLEHLNDKNSVIQESIVKRPILVILAPSNKAINNNKENRCFHMLLFTFENNEWKSYKDCYSNEAIKKIFDEVKNC
ncbi:MAG: hypothetical protein K2J16_01530 [Clostridia bacterium]|nr:hypothetical protein [Clostridia bacterium]